MKNKRCAACDRLFRPRPQTPNQSFCSNTECQRERRRQWQRLKLQADPDYQDNQARAQRAWNKRNPDYWREYRQSHRQYVERNRAMQQQRNAKARVGQVAKMDVSDPLARPPSGFYRLSLIPDNGIAKVDVWTVEIRVHACKCMRSANIAKR